MAFDIFNPMVSVVAEGVEGKTILVYGNNGLGKTPVGCKLPKPFYFPFERGINAINGIPFLPMNRWSDFTKVVKAFTDDRKMEQVKGMYQTLIIDTVEICYKKCEEYVCQMYEAKRVKDGNGGYGLWKEVEDEFWKQINLLTSAGFTVYFIAHEMEVEETDALTGETYTQKQPKGDKRAIKPICDLVDFIAYIKSNGVDENGKEIFSSAYFKNTREYKARSRFTHMIDCIPVFTAENLQKAIKDAVIKQEENDGVQAVSYEQQKELYTSQELNYDTLQASIKEKVTILYKYDQANSTTYYSKDYLAIVENFLGQGKTASEATANQLQQLDNILNSLEDLIEKNSISL